MPRAPRQEQAGRARSRSISKEETNAEAYFAAAKQGAAHAVGRVASDDPELTSLELTGNQELSLWPPPRQAAAIMMLTKNTHVKKAVLSNLQLVDNIAGVLAEVLRVNTTLTSLNVENNDLRETSLCEIALALASNTTLLELKIAHQKRQIPTVVEEAFASALEENRTLLKLGFSPRQTQTRELIERALARNANTMRENLVRQAELETKLDEAKWDEAAALAATPEERVYVAERRREVEGPPAGSRAPNGCLRGCAACFPVCFEPTPKRQAGAALRNSSLV